MRLHHIEFLEPEASPGGGVSVRSHVIARHGATLTCR